MIIAGISINNPYLNDIIDLSNKQLKSEKYNDSK
jgi:hypothetical protein